MTARQLRDELTKLIRKGHGDSEVYAPPEGSESLVEPILAVSLERRGLREARESQHIRRVLREGEAVYLEVREI